MSESEPSSPSSTGSYEPFQPGFTVKVTDPIKDGDVISYTIKTIRTSEGTDFTVHLDYEDFEYLHHCLITEVNVDGIIVPPLPVKPVVDARDAETKSKNALGSSSKVLLADEFDKDCRCLEKYIRLVISHHILGKCKCLETFLTQKQAPVRAKARFGIITKLYGAMESRKINHTDIDEYFQKERDFAICYVTNVHEASNHFKKMINCHQRICNAYAHFSTALNLGNAYKDGAGLEGNRLLAKFSEAVDDAKHGADVDIVNDENTLGFHLDLYARYADSVKEMLNRRTCLLVNYEDANRAFDKAKPTKKAAAEEVKIKAEKAFEDCSELARTELVIYKRQRLLAYQESLSLYAEAKVKTARDTYTLLAKHLLYFKQLDNQKSLVSQL